MRLENVMLEGDVVYNEVIEIYGSLTFNPTKNIKLTTSKNIINYGKVISKPLANVIHEISFVGIDESKFIGGGMEPIDSDVGLWCMGAGVLDIQGAYKKRFTNTTGSVLAGAKSVTVKDATNWRVGDEIVINPTIDIPPAHGDGITWNQDTKTYSDPFLERLERRIITAVSGNTVSFNEPLRFNHLEYKTTPNKLAPNGRHYTAYVTNLTSNVKIHGTKTGKSHIFHCAHSHNHDGSVKHNIQKSYIDHAEIYYMGPRKQQGHHYEIPMIVTGRYAMHFHHGGDGTIGTMVSNCAFHDNDTRACVPHMANGITFKGNVIAFNLGEGMWWDIGEITNDAVYDSNLLCGIRWDKTLSGSISILFGIGSNNKAINNWIVYGHVGDENGSGALQWSANNESVWVVDGNGGNSNNCLDWTWQNSGRPHDISRQQAYCNTFGLSHGAYGNPYIYTENEYYQSPVHVKAAASLAMGSSFERCVFDGLGVMDWLVNKQVSAAGDRFNNQFRECEFKNARVALRMDNTAANGEFSVPVGVELINCIYTSIQKKVEFYVSEPNNPIPSLDLSVLVQNGNTAERHRKGGVTAVGKFAPDKFGIGDGLKAEYYKGLNFEQKIFERIDSMVRHDMWRVDKPIFPEGVHYKLNEGAFSVRWTGEIEPWATGPWQFKIMGAIGYRLWINNQLIINSPANKGDSAEFTLSSAVNLEGLRKYPIKLECYEPGDNQKSIIFYWKHPSMIDFEDVPKCQMYSGTSITLPPPPPQVFKSVRKTKDFTRNNCPTGQTGNVYTYVVDAGQFESTISQGDADGKADADITSKGQAQANQFGTCKIITMPTPCEEFKWQDYLAMHKDLRDAGINTEAKALSHYQNHGIKEKRRANFDCMDPALKQDPGTWPKVVTPPPTKTLTKTIKVYSDGSVEVA